MSECPTREELTAAGAVIIQEMIDTMVAAALVLRAAKYQVETGRVPPGMAAAEVLGLACDLALANLTKTLEIVLPGAAVAIERDAGGARPAPPRGLAV